MLICDPLPDCPRKPSSAFRSCWVKEVVESAAVAVPDDGELVGLRESMSVFDALVVDETMMDRIASAGREGNSIAKAGGITADYCSGGPKLTLTGNSISNGATIT
jgi:hypothetical protein